MHLTDDQAEKMGYLVLDIYESIKKLINSSNFPENIKSMIHMSICVKLIAISISLLAKEGYEKILLDKFIDNLTDEIETIKEVKH